MPKFYIHVDNGNGFVADEEGQAFPNLDAAQQQAIRGGAEIIADELTRRCQRVTLTLYIEDENHVRLSTVPMRASMEC